MVPCWCYRYFQLEGCSNTFSFNYLFAYISLTKSRNSTLCIQVAGYFTYGVMAVSVTTFTFWSLFGTHILPAAVYQGSAVSLALQLACSVLVCFSSAFHGLIYPSHIFWYVS